MPVFQNYIFSHSRAKFVLIASEIEEFCILYLVPLQCHPPTSQNAVLINGEPDKKVLPKVSNVTSSFCCQSRQSFTISTQKEKYEQTQVACVQPGNKNKYGIRSLTFCWETIFYKYFNFFCN